MPLDFNIREAAFAMISQHGRVAGLAANQRAEELLARGDAEGAAAWRRVVRDIEELRRQGRESEAIE